MGVLLNSTFDLWNVVRISHDLVVASGSYPGGSFLPLAGMAQCSSGEALVSRMESDTVPGPSSMIEIV
jgi:hypothetical protein